MTCCGRCKICRHEWEELENERDAAKARVAELEKDNNRLRCEWSRMNDVRAKDITHVDMMTHQANDLTKERAAIRTRATALEAALRDLRNRVQFASDGKMIDALLGEKAGGE